MYVIIKYRNDDLNVNCLQNNSNNLFFSTFENSESSAHDPNDFIFKNI